MTTDPIKQRIQQLIPEVMELKFGCEFWANVIAEDEDTWREILFVNVSERMYDDTLILGRIKGNWETCHIPKQNVMEILGSSITFAVVLRAIASTWKAINQRERKNIELLIFVWNLTKDYDDQSQETRDFIGSLIGVQVLTPQGTDATGQI